MLQEQQPKQTKQTTDNILEFYFCSAPRTRNPLDKLLSWAISSYQKLWGWDTNLQHTIVRIGGECYELTTKGLVRYSYTPDLLEMPRLLGGWVYLLTEDDTEIVKRVLDRQLENQPKLNLWHNFSYLLSVKWHEFWADHDYIQEDATVQLTEVDNEGVLRFNLPYTCVTPALLALDVIVDYEKDLDNHLPPTIFSHCLSLACIGTGALWSKLP